MRERLVAASLPDRTLGFWCQTRVSGVRLGQEGGEAGPHSKDADALDRGPLRGCKPLSYSIIFLYIINIYI